MAIALVSAMPFDTASTGNKFAPVAAGYAKPQATPMDPETPAAMPSPAQIGQALSQVNDSFGKKGQELVAFVERDEETGIDVIKVVEKGTEEVIRQFPSEEIIQIARTIDQTGEGQLSLLRVSA